MGGFRKIKRSGKRGIAWGLGAALALGMAIATPQVALAAEDNALLEITKSASKETLKPGETMEYRIELGCSTITDLGCRNATLSDLIPAEFEIVEGSVAVSNATAESIDVSGNQVTVVFGDELGDGTTGLLENADAVITIQVKLRDNLSFDQNGVPIVNTATADADNAADVSDDVAVTPVIELKLGTEVSKGYDPALAQAEPGTPTTLTVNGVNKSNAGVDTLTLTDPTDPEASPNPFEYLEMATLESLTFPDGAAPTATVEYWVGGTWVTEVLSASDMPHAPPAGAQGIRVTFTAADGSKLPTNASGGFELGLKQRPEVANLTEKFTAENTVKSEVALGDQSAKAENEADYTIHTTPISVEAAKQFNPNELAQGGKTQVTLGATNTSAVSLDSLKIREPASGSFAEELDFTGFTSAVTYPAKAATATFTLYYIDKAGAPQQQGPLTLGDGDAFPELPADFGSLDYFELDFAGPIEPGSETTIDFAAVANAKGFDPETGAPLGTVTNVVGVEGTFGDKTATDEADDTVTLEAKKLEIATEKKLTPGEIWGYKGEGVLVQLPTTVVKPGSNAPATEIIVSDPELEFPGDPNSPPKDSAFWDKFTPEAITNTDVPDGATLTVRYWDTDESKWIEIPGFTGLTGTVNKDLPADILDKIGGLQFVFTNPDPGFEPHELPDFNVNPSFTATLDEQHQGPEPITLANCATSSGAIQVGDETIAEDVTDEPACDDLVVKAPRPGEYDLFEKTWLDAGNPAQIVQRTGDHAKTRLHWSTENLAFDRMTLGETRLGSTPGAGPADPVAQTTFEAFNLVKVKAVTNDKAFAEGWDKITSIDLWIGGQWVRATNATEPFYTKTMSDIELTADEQRDATAVRIVFEENRDGRIGAGADAPAPGSGLWKSMGRDRKVDLEWELRDVRRSDPGKAVIASEIFNVAGKPGLVKNWGSATGEQPGGGTEHDQDDDDITIVPRPLGVTVSKGWSGGPLGVPPGDVPAESYPTSRVTIKATNTSQQKVDQLSIIDPGDGKESPFEIFNLYAIVDAPHPVTGGDPNKTLVILTKADGSIIDPAGIGGLTPGQAKALTPAELKDVVKVELRHQGRIATKATATLQLDFQLRKTHRSDPNKPVTTVDSPVKNGTVGSVTDLLGLEQEHSVEAADEAQIRLDTFDLAVQTTKKFTPDNQRVIWDESEPGYEQRLWDPIRMDLTARPSGTGRTDKLVVTDSGENRVPGTPSAKSFWNAFSFEGFTGDTLEVPTPVTHVQAEVLYGDFETDIQGFGRALNFTPDNTPPAVDGWVKGSDAPVKAVDRKIEGAAAALLANIPNTDYDKIRGIRLTYTRLNDAGERLAFENPANPEAKIALEVKRRAYLVSNPAEPVPDSDAQISAPGEPVKNHGGELHNTVDADAESYLKGPDSGSGEPEPLLTASDDDTVRYTYLSEGIEVAVEKTPVGAQAPGSVIPFKLKTTNTAERVADAETNESAGILDPIIVDLFPVDDNPVEADRKPLLIFDPDMEESKRFSFALENVYSDGPNEIPVDPSKVKVTYLGKNQQPVAPGGEIFGVKFEFPEGTVLYPEEVYTVTVNMMFRPGVEAGSEHSLENRFYVQSPHQEFDSCNFTSSDHGSKECWAATEVYPTEAGALRGKKYVRANDPELGTAIVANPNSVAECKPAIGSEPDGFYVGSCVPITKPLGIETWREELQNTGTTAMEKVVTIDSLPKVGDQGALVLLPRNSEWQPTWVGNVEVVEGAAPDGVDYRHDVTPELFYSDSDSTACTADLKPTETPQCDGFWRALTPDVDPTTVRHVKSVFTFPADKRFAPGDRLAYTFETRTPAQAPKMTADTVAWNSVAVGAQTIGSDGTTKASVLPTEGLRVGVALASGPLAIEKTVTGNGAHFAPETFEVDVVCEVPAREGSEEGPVKLEPVRVTVTAGEPVTLDEQFPYGAKCRVAEVPGANGETSSEIPDDTVTIGRDKANVPVLKLTNRYELGSFQVAKRVDGAENQAGDPIDYGAFEVAAECTFLGEEIALDPASAELTAGGTAWLVDQLPIGAQCKLTEVDAKGGSAELKQGDTTIPQNEDGSWTITVTEDAASVPANNAELVLTNTMPVGAIELSKELAGAGAGAVSDATKFSFDVLCTFEGNEVYSATLELTKAEALAGKKLSIGKLPVGAECGIAETGAGGATATELVDGAGAPVTGPITIGDTETVKLTAVNFFDAGVLHVAKEITGAGAELWGAGPFEVSLACTLDGSDVSIPGGAERELTAENGFAGDYSDLLVGAECGLTETNTGGATTSEIVDAEGAPITEPIVIGVDEVAQLRVINTFDLGGLTVKKELTGAGASLAGDKVFTVSLECTVDRGGVAAAIEIPGGADRELSKQNGLTASYEQLPVGAKCELRETGTGGGTTVSITPNAGDIRVGAVTVAAGAATQLTVVNEFPAVPPTPGEPGLPGTGGSAQTGLIVGGVALLLLGATLVVLRVRRSRKDQ
ncbi:DUF5979 domain-containing protein [Leucobacter albus]|uniref:DUF5979 domain-containing protein n=1 Tax=Leucobacter albus TaxID=272210 RepID=A0ABW3TNG9_9MICO